MSLKRKQWMETPSPSRSGTPLKTSPTKLVSTPGYAAQGKREGTPGRDRKKPKMEVPGAPSGAATPTVAFGEFASFGRNIFTRAIIIRDTLKKRRGPINIPDLEWNLRVADPEIRISDELLEAVKKHEGIVHNATMNTIEYKPPFDWTTPADLLTYIKTHSSQPGGIPITRIRTEYSGPEQPNTLLLEWETQGKILIMRTPGNMPLPDPGARVRRNAVMRGAEANAPSMMDVPGGKNWRAVFWDGVRERGEAAPGKVEEEFREMWADVKTPAEADLPKLLAALGHKVDPRDTAKTTAVKGPGKKKKKGGGSRNVSKLTNVHLLEKGIDLSKDYVPE